METAGPRILEIAAGASPADPLPLFVGGRWEAAASGATLDTREPATGKVLARVADGGAEDLARAVARGREAAAAWASIPPAERGEAIAALGARLRDAAAEFGALDARDTGSPVAAMTADAIKGAKAMARAAGLATELKGETVPATAGRLHYSTLEPWGVVGRITAFNHPILFSAARLAPALVAGNAVILKPSELAPLAPLALAELAADLLPEGLLSVLVGGPALGQAMARDPELRRLSFTGSPGTALAIQGGAAESGVIKTMTFELGGKNPIVVFGDADLDAAAGAVVRGMNFTRVQGQSCGSTSRAFLHSDVREAVMERVLDAVGRIRLGDPLDPETEMGALIDDRAVQRCRRFVDDAVAGGGRVLAGGAAPTDPDLQDGSFFLPTVLDRVDHDSPLAQQEVFGPVLSVFEWTDPAEALRLANDVRFGLTASVWTCDLDAAFSMASQLEAGFIWVNDVELRYGGVPFGGWKDSGTGLEDGLEELLSFTRARFVNVRFG
ncbi:MAG TPA: aldehyde dehydrogenase family protein [Baekduia sp.]|uniref:aldehyde dehydrogenase family protein n=1 Tax=Baekduia sp. TaxID=2600305 RepID=UPI002C689F4A|nr:aldehyde dehydrogenase family protein [Baekduia sp.]HMJ36551.1 aldehyde dehydrogenase family protein [Baekduia sp.]